MSKTVKRLYDLEIDEISLVDRPANQHGLVAIAKRAEEARMPVYDAEGYEVDESTLEVGDVVYTEDGVEHVMLDDDTAAELGYTEDDTYDGGTSYASDYEPELAGVGKAFTGPAGLGPRGRKAFDAGSRFKSGFQGARAGANSEGSTAGQRGASTYRNRKKIGAGAGVGVAGVGGYEATKKSLGQSVLEELSKSLDQGDRDEVISKLGDLVAEAQASAEEAWSVAKSLQDQRDYEDYAELAAGYDLPVNPGELGAVLKRASEHLPQRDVQLLDRVFTAAGAGLYDEVGYNGYQESDVMGQVAAIASQAVTKNDLSFEQATVALFEANPGAYDEYIAESR